MTNPTTKPRYLTLPIGYPVGNSGADDFAGAVKMNERLHPNGTTVLPPIIGTAAIPLQGVVNNRGKTPFTLAIQQSNDNGKADVYAAINIRVAGAAVASVVVPPGAQVTFSVETVTKNFVKVAIPASSFPFGDVTFKHDIGELSYVARVTA